MLEIKGFKIKIVPEKLEEMVNTDAIADKITRTTPTLIVAQLCEIQIGNAPAKITVQSYFGVEREYD